MSDTRQPVLPFRTLGRVVVLVALAAATTGIIGPIRRADAAVTATAVSAQGVIPPGASRFVAVDPVRVLDTRVPTPVGSRFVAAGTSMTLQLGGVAGVPPTASAVALNLTATDSAAAGHLTVWPGGTTMPEVSNLNLTAAGQTRANLVITPLGPAGAIQLFSSGGAHLVADVAGYFLPDRTSGGGRFNAVDPSRLLDTRAGLGTLVARPVADDTSLRLGVLGRASVPPSGVAAVVVNVTAVDSSGPGFVTVWPTGQTRPVASNLNTTRAGETVPNAVVVPVGTDGSIDLYTQTRTHLVVDIVGWFSSASADTAPTTDGLFVPVPPRRVADTRVEQGVRGLPAGRRVDLTLGGQGGIPATGVAAAVLNLTATEAYGDGFVTAYPAATPLPVASTVNPANGDTRAGLTIARLGHSSRISLLSSAGTELAADVTGYFLGSPRSAEPGVSLDPPGPDLAVGAALDAVLALPAFRGMSVSATAWAEGSGDIYTRGADAGLVPASNQKLYTAVGALRLLPSEHRFVTTVSTDAAGAVYLTARGDPTLRRADLNDLAARLRAAGITAVTDIVIDATRYEPQHSLPGWDHLLRSEFGPLSALTVDDNRYRNDAAFHADPDSANGALFRDILLANGIAVTGVVRPGPTPTGTTTRAEHASAPLPALVDIMLTSSDNEIAEALVREIDVVAGGRGTTRGGLDRIAMIVAELGASPGLSADGSGLSHADRHSSRELVALLVSLRGTPIGQDVRDGLAIAARTGTLASRLRTPSTYGNVRAKTGTLEISRSLSGYLELSDGTDIAFSIIVNGAATGTATRAAIDQWVATLAAA